MSFWDSTTDLRRVEFVALLVTMIVPVVSGAVLLTLRYRIKSLQIQANLSQGTIYEENVQTLGTETRDLSRELAKTRKDLKILRQITAARQITPAQEKILLEKLSGVKASPVIVAAYAFEEDSAAYASEIVQLLRRAGWEATFNKASMNDFKGISLGKINLTGKPLSGLPELADALKAASFELHQREIALESIAGQLQDGSLLIVVGRK